MTTRFEARKQKILEQLDAPDSEYHDLSPKGSIDAPIRDLISEINGFDGLVTTSSCSGRISVFLEGRKADSDPLKSAEVEEGEGTRAGPGGAWLFISHDPVEVPQATSSSYFTSKFGLENATGGAVKNPGVHCRFVHLKFEPMVSLNSIYCGEV
jgi:tRNA wybutosine-synthesizing protein 3